MNKQELIERLEGLKNIFGNECEYVKIDFVIELASELDEPQKVVVPKFVADWYEENKDSFEANLYRFVYNLTSIFDSAKMNEFERWFLTANTKPFQILINMHQFGYEVEKEKRYTVVMKETKQPLYYNASENKLFFSMAKIASHFTRQQLEKINFGWVFDCEGIEVEEVTE